MSRAPQDHTTVGWLCPPAPYNCLCFVGTCPISASTRTPTAPSTSTPNAPPLAPSQQPCVFVDAVASRGAPSTGMVAFSTAGASCATGALSRFYKYRQWCRIVYPNIRARLQRANLEMALEDTWAPPGGQTGPEVDRYR
jgi:hypothetical protein